ncbi:MAG: PEP-CTERM sorting domain-containing protein, partial [Planctomycetes bacterium]|nr:PEP-CTERM sorting domain-containing protein [Planctomycetota bacterium]
AIAAVPEPVSGALLIIACGCWGAFARRRKAG